MIEETFAKNIAKAAKEDGILESGGERVSEAENEMFAKIAAAFGFS